MRFLHSFPLPLLLIWISLVNSQANLLGFNKTYEKSPSSNVRLSRSANEISLISFDFQAFPHGLNKTHEKSPNSKLRLSRSANESQTIANTTNESEDASESSLADLSLEQIKDLLDKATEKSGETKKKIDETKTILNDAEKKLVLAKEDYDTKKKKYDSLNEGNTLAEEATEAFNAADQRFSTAKTDFSNADEELKRVQAAKKRKTVAEQEKKDQESKKTILETEVSSTLKEKTEKFKPLKKLNEDIASYEETDCTITDCTGPSGITALLAQERAKRPAVSAAFETAKTNWETATKNLDNCKNAISDLTNEIRQLIPDSLFDETELQGIFDKANEEKTNAENDFNEKKAAKEKADQAISTQSEVRAARTQYTLSEFAKDNLIKEEKKFRELLAELENRFIKENARVGALKQRYEEKKKAMEPKTGSVPVVVWVLVPILGLLLIGGIVIFILWRKRRAAATKEDKDKKEKQTEDPTPASSVSKSASAVTPAENSAEPNIKTNTTATPTPLPTETQATGQAGKAKAADDDIKELKVKEIPEPEAKLHISEKLNPESLVKKYLGNYVYEWLTEFPGFVGRWLSNKYEALGQDATGCRYHVLDIMEEITAWPWLANLPVCKRAYDTVTFVTGMNTILGTREYWRRTPDESVKQKQERTRFEAIRNEQRTINHPELVKKQAKKNSREEGGADNQDNDKKSTSVSIAPKTDESDNNSSRGDSKRKSQENEKAKKKRSAERNRKGKGKGEGTSKNNTEDTRRTKQHHVTRHYDGKKVRLTAVRLTKDVDPPHNEDNNTFVQKIKKDFEKEHANICTEFELELLDFVKDIIKTVRRGETYTFKKKQILYVLKLAKDIFKKEKKGILIDKPIASNLVSCADIHGHMDVLLTALSLPGGEMFGDEWKKHDFLFLGDYVDRGKHSLEVIMILYSLKILYPKKFTILRGNHETYEISTSYGFYKDLTDKFGNIDGSRYHEFFSYVFGYMPLFCVRERFFFMHGGIPRLMELLKLLKITDKETPNLNDLIEALEGCLFYVNNHPVACDLLWADPAYGIKGHHRSSRGGSAYDYGADVVIEFCNMFGFKCVVRGHLMVTAGVEWFADMKHITIFPITTYEPEKLEARNYGSIMMIDKYRRARFYYLAITKKSNDDDAANQRRAIDFINKSLYSTCMHSQDKAMLQNKIDPSETSKET